MTTFETSQGFANIDGYRINVTARLDPECREAMKELVEKTVKMWLYVAKLIARGERQCAVEYSAETSMAARHKTLAAQIAEPRVTVWGDVSGGAGFTVHSHSYGQDALDVYYARLDALATFAIVQEPPKAPPATKTPANNENAANSPSDAKSAQTATPPPSVDGVTKVSGKKTAATLPNGALFELPIYQVKLRSKDDSQYYEVYTKYGSNLGQFPELLIYTDNEIAKTNGVLDFLGGFGLTPGKDKLGEWVLRGVVKDKGDKKNLYAVSIRSAA